jgi:hypothetical protein
MKIMGFVVAFALCGLFLFSMLNFGVGVQEAYNISDGLATNPQISSTIGNLTDNLGGMDETAGTHENSTNAQGQITENYGNVLLGGIGSTISAFTQMPLLIYNVVIKQVGITIGIHPIVIGLLTAFMLILMVLMLWRVIRTGE